MQLPAAHFSALATIAYLYYQEVKDKKKIIKLAVMAAYHNGYNQYYDLGKKHLDELANTNSCLSLAYYYIILTRRER
jgi:hypothetical protein